MKVKVRFQKYNFEYSLKIFGNISVVQEIEDEEVTVGERESAPNTAPNTSSQNIDIPGPSGIQQQTPSSNT